ncbi:response regulator transcription factor [Dethiobacter alkaliphilus]|uniref:response regulator transcription factor n=1 Tax=Dethiobacter alkaliphilus TaxID=427926 RepID=UPI002225EBCE|nr:response regulator transcription factor [Dethiobacter alkaliphilus]MCW3489502.1 response regulator transcription factor [Dethiobacter alkaliphilus]
MANGKILVIDDEVEIVNFIAKYLIREGYTVFRGYSADDAIRLIAKENPGLIILDIMLPDMDGTELCRNLREKEILTPILLVSAKGDDADKVLGLGLGADDYITKPFSPNELIARVKAHMRRNELLKRHQDDSKSFLSYTDLEINLKSREVKLSGSPVYLTGKEFDLLSFLANHPNQVFSRIQLYEQIWGIESMGDDRTVMVHIRHLREKIEEDVSNPHYIKTVWGTGYKFSPG